MAKQKGWRPLTPDEQRQIAERYATGETMEQLCRAFGRGKNALRLAIRAHHGTIRPRGYPAGRAWSSEHREAHLRATRTDEFRAAHRESLLRNLPSMHGPATNSPIERRMHDALRANGIGFETHAPMLGKYLVDILIHQAPLIIEADGMRHRMPAWRERDAIRDAALAAAGYRVFRFTGSEINRDAMRCVQTVIEACGLVAEREPEYTIRTSFAGPAHPRWKGGRGEWECEQCHKTFRAYRRAGGVAPRFCGHSCYWQSLRS